MKEKYFLNEPFEQVQEIYLRPESDSGAQYEMKVFCYADILYALENMTSGFSFFELLESGDCSRTFTYDPGDPEYEEIKKQYEKDFYYMEGNNFHTMLTLCRLALTKEFIKDNLKDSLYKGVETYALYKIAEKFLSDYYKREHFSDVDDVFVSFHIAVGDKVEVGYTSVFIHGFECEVQAYIDFNTLAISMEIAGLEVRRQEYKNLIEFVDALDGLDFNDLTTPNDDEEELYWDSSEREFTDRINKATKVVCPECGYVIYFEGKINENSFKKFCEKCGTKLSAADICHNDDDDEIIDEACPYCGFENKFVNPNGYIQTCEQCGEEMFLCSRCLDADDNKDQHCDWHKTNNGGCCFRGRTQQND